MALKYNNTEVQNVTYNGQEVQKVVYNGTTVWEAGKWYPVQTYIASIDKWENIAPVEHEISTEYIELSGQQLIFVGGDYDHFTPKKVRIIGSIVFGDSSTDMDTYSINAICDPTANTIIVDPSGPIDVVFYITGGNRYAVGINSVYSTYYAKRIKITSFEEYR